MCLLAMCTSFLEKCLGILFIFLLGCLAFLLLLLNCMSCLEIKSLLVTSFANIFSQSIGCLFILPMVSFAAQKLVGLIKYNLFLF